MTRIAIMQPYFLPYAGYFRLFAASDLFVVYDCVQFPRRGWLHRNRLPGPHGEPRWLTLPLAKAPRDTAIRDLAFSADAETELPRRLARFPLLGSAMARHHDLAGALLPLPSHPLDYIQSLLGRACRLLDLPDAMLRSSTLECDPALKGQARIIEIARRLGATSYVNPPGGRSLYDPMAFHRAGLELRFLDDHRGPSWSILYRLLNEPAAAVAREIRSAATLAA